MSLKNLLKKANRDLLVTPEHEAWLNKNHNIHVHRDLWNSVSGEVTTPERDRSATFSASARGACPREQVFRFTSVKPIERFDSDLIAIFHQGTFMHMKWQMAGLDAGWLDDVEVPVRSDKYRMTGTMDGMGEVPLSHPLRSQHAQYGWELKSINSAGFKWRMEKGPSKVHLLQIHAYMLASGIKLWVLIYENKDTQEWKEFVVHEDPEITQKVVDELTRLNEYVDNRALPAPLGECEKRKGAFLRCPFAHVCLETRDWPDEPAGQRRIKLKETR